MGDNEVPDSKTQAEVDRLTEAMRSANLLRNAAAGQQDVDGMTRGQAALEAVQRDIVALVKEKPGNPDAAALAAEVEGLVGGWPT